MDEAVEPVTPLYVHQVALTTINVPDSGDGSPSLFPVVGVWADLSPMQASGFSLAHDADRTLPVVVITDSVLDATNPAVMNIVVAQAHDGPGLHDDDDQMAVAPFGPHWSLRVPTTWVAMATVVMGTPLQMRMVLIDGPPPLTPEHHILTLADAGPVVVPSMGGVQTTLTQVMGAEWSVPIPVHVEHSHAAPEINLMRDQLWATIAGVALGQTRALNKVESFAEWVATLNSGDAEEQAKYDSAMQAAEWIAESSLSEPLPRDSNGHVVWPAAMASLVDKIESSIDETTLTSLDEGLAFEDAVEAFGLKSAMTALCVTAAVKANTATTSGHATPADEKLTPAYLLGMWLDEQSDDPWWATRATHHLLLHHDTDVLVNLLSCNPGSDSLAQGHGPLTMRLFHVVTEALSSLGLSPDQFAEHVRGLDLTPAGFDDTVYVSTRLLAVCAEEAHTDNDQCPGCVAVESIVSETSDQYRLVQAAVGALPVLADLSAQLNGLQVGDEDWKSHREGFLMHWMEHTAIHPVND